MMSANPALSPTAAGAILDALNWRYATKIFDQTKKLSEDDLRSILEAIRLAPSSYGLQPFVTFVASDAVTKSALRKAAYNQPQLETASHVLVFVAEKNITKNKMKLLAALEEQNVGKDKIAFMLKYINIADFIRKVTFSRFAYASEQAHLALGIAILTAAVQHIDACPMGGFSARKVAKVLGLDTNLRPVALLALGYRSSDDTVRPKYRLPIDDIIRLV